MLTRSDGKTHFYNGSARKIVAAFGTLFNNIILQQYSGDGVPFKSIKVPIVYASKEHFIARLRDDNLDKTLKTNVTLPTISFVLSALTYDPSRQINALGYKTKVNQANPNLKDKRWTPVPYIYNFNLSVHVSKTEDGLQIIEQILPYFTPELNVAINMVDSSIDVPIALNSVTFEDNYEEGFDNNRMIRWDLELEAKGLFYKPVDLPSIIESIVVDIHDDNDFSTPIEFGTITQAGNIFSDAFSDAFI